MYKSLRIALTTCLMTLSASSFAVITVTDDLGNIVTLERPAQRVISLAPHVTELIFAAGAGSKIVGTVKYSDYPESAKSIQRVGDLRQVDLERIIALKPDLLVVWMHGAFNQQLETLRKSGIPFFFSEPQKLNQVPDTLTKFGQMMGTENAAQAAATSFSQQLQQLSSQYQNKPKVRTFYQVWGRPLYTLNDKHIVSDAIRLCGGDNIFGQLSASAPVVTVEAVLQENPELIIGTDAKGESKNDIVQWKSFNTLLANKNHNLLSIDGDLMNRPGPRIIDGAKAICSALEQSRQHRSSASGKGQK
ncbi:cobalamin-binding protein [Undibacterium sp. Dicai25W]|uniref:cobalamin-binding protein n=1 Tax=Undibacterium sp. Dicai25W TaxID=3413034 RepID=UPI003BF321D8